jgi:uncharacterized membrane protein YphA (DoxX/SURF4 family)
MNPRWLIGWPDRVARHLQYVVPLFVRIVLSWVFMWSGWSKLQNYRRSSITLPVAGFRSLAFR